MIRHLCVCGILSLSGCGWQSPFFQETRFTDHPPWILFFFFKQLPFPDNNNNNQSLQSCWRPWTHLSVCASCNIFVRSQRMAEIFRWGDDSIWTKRKYSSSVTQDSSRPVNGRKWVEARNRVSRPMSGGWWHFLAIRTLSVLTKV